MKNGREAVRYKLKKCNFACLCQCNIFHCFEDKTFYLHTPTLHQFLHKNATLFVRCSNNSLYTSTIIQVLNSANILSKTFVSFLQKNCQSSAIYGQFSCFNVIHIHSCLKFETPISYTRNQALRA